MNANYENRLLTPIEIGQHPNIPEGPISRHSFRHQVGQIRGELHVIAQRLVITDHVTLNTKFIVIDPAEASDLGNDLEIELNTVYFTYTYASTVLLSN